MPFIRRFIFIVHTMLFVPTLTLFGAWQLPGLKLPECRLQKSVMRLPGRPCVRLPNITLWTLLGSLLAVTSLTWLREDDQDKSNAEHHFPPPVPLYLAFAVSFGLWFLASLQLPPWVFSQAEKWGVRGVGFPLEMHCTL